MRSASTSSGGRRRVADARRVSVIVSTYNRSDHLRKCIASLEMQTRLPDEVVIADDGSDAEHVAAIEELASGSPLEVVHARQEHDGFRLAANRNNGVRHSSGDYLFFTDGDALFFPDVLERHLAAARFDRQAQRALRGLERARAGSWVTGGCLHLSRHETNRLSIELIRQGRLEELWPGTQSGTGRPPGRGGAGRKLPGTQSGTGRPPGRGGAGRKLPGKRDKRLRRLWMEHARLRLMSLCGKVFPVEAALRKIKMIGIQCSLRRADFERVNGYDEEFVGWGREDDDLALRLLLAGVWGRSVMLTSRVFHMAHRPGERVEGPGGRMRSPNIEYHERRRRGRFRCANGLFKKTS